MILAPKPHRYGAEAVLRMRGDDPHDRSRWRRVIPVLRMRGDDPTLPALR